MTVEHNNKHQLKMTTIANPQNENIVNVKAEFPAMYTAQFIVSYLSYHIFSVAIA